MRVFITGGTGLIGSEIVRQLSARGDQPVVLTRSPGKARSSAPAGVEFVEGDPQQAGDWMKSVDGCQGVINLVGESVFGRRWNAEQKKRIRDSRIDSTNNLVQAMVSADNAPAALSSASAIGYYGNVPEAELTENSPAGNDFLARVCQEWEQAASRAAEQGIRTAMVRIGVVLSKDGGALKQMLPPFKLGLGGPIGAGRQWMSWVHLADIAGAFIAALDHAEAVGPINGTAPEPVRNKEFSKALASALHRPCLFPVPPFMLRVMFGEVAEVITGSQRVLPTKLQQLGYQFQHPNIREAMQAIFGK